MIDRITEYLDQIISEYEFKKVISFNNSDSIGDSSISLETFQNCLINSSFAEFNFMNDVQNRTKDVELSKEIQKDAIDEILLIKLNCDKILEKYVNIIKQLVDTKHIEDKIVMDGLNGFLVIENDDIVLYSIYRFFARDGESNVYKGKKLI